MEIQAYMNTRSIIWVKMKIKVKVTQLCQTLCDPMDYSPWNSLDQENGMGSLSLLKGFFPIQGSNPGLPHCRWILYQLSHKALGNFFPFSAWQFLHLQNGEPDFMVGKCVLLKMTNRFQSKQISFICFWTSSEAFISGENILKSESC